MSLSARTLTASLVRRRAARRVALGGVSLLLVLGACKKGEAPTAPSTPAVAPAPKDKADVDLAKLAIFQPPLPAVFEAAQNPSTDDKIALGRQLYFDKRLSKNHDVSCNTCHRLDAYGVDQLKVSLGHRKQAGSRNSPTVYNAAGHFLQFWDGRAETVEAQAIGPIMNPVEMALPSEARLVATLRSIPEYQTAFTKAFPDDKEPITLARVGQAIAAFERKLVTPAPFDKLLAGDKTALTEQEKAGLNKFMEVGCTACHLGTLLGGKMFQKAGLVQAWPSQVDPGRFQVTKQDADKMFFKVPSLRNVAMTAPYFHDGSVATLDEAVTQMARHQLGKQLSKEDVSSIVTFLRSLTGTIPVEYTKEPALPKSTPRTPPPDPA